jgi:glutathionylspermidine synthase
VCAGFDTAQLFMDEVVWDGTRFVDTDARPISRLWKLYPHEWLWDEGAASLLLDSDTEWMEPAWKSIASSKALLVVLWKVRLRQ